MAGRIDRGGNDDNGLVFGRLLDVAGAIAHFIVGVPALGLKRQENSHPAVVGR